MRMMATTEINANGIITTPPFIKSWKMSIDGAGAVVWSRVK
jgi:hypothetical protein